MKKHSRMFLILLVIVCILPGCTSYDLSTKDEDLIAEYAADALLQADENYSKKLLDADEIQIETEAEEENTTDNSTEGETEGEGEEVSNLTMSQALGLDNFTIDYITYDISDTYTNAVVAGEGMKIIVLKFNVTNISSSEALFDLEHTMLTYSYKGTFNETFTYNSQITMLLNALNSYKDTFAAGESKEVVLIYKAPKEQLVDGITSITIAVDTGEANNIIKLQ